MGMLRITSHYNPNPMRKRGTPRVGHVGVPRSRVGLGLLADPQAIRPHTPVIHLNFTPYSTCSI